MTKTRRWSALVLTTCLVAMGLIGTASVAEAASATAVAGQTCTPSGAWYTEDVAPQATVSGLLFAGPSAAAIDYYHPMSGNLQGIVDSSMTITAASGYHVALVWEINRFGTSGYATIVAEPYMNGWTPGQTGTLTVTQSTLGWTSKITSGSGSQGSPVTLAAMGDLFPQNVLLTEGLHLGTNSIAGQSSLVSGLSGCITQSFVKPQPVVATTTTATKDCTAQTVTTVTETTTTDWVWLGGAWVKGQPVVQDTTGVRAATTAECPASIASSTPTAIADPGGTGSAGVLAATGSDWRFPGLVGGLLVLSGAALVWLTNRRRSQYME